MESLIPGYVLPKRTMARVGSEMFTRLERRALADGIVEQIVERVRDGSLAPGDRLPTEMDLVRQLGVSRSSVREALKGLEVLGVVTRTNTGTFVSSSSPASALSRFLSADLVARRLEVVDVYEARRILEIELTTLALRNITDEDIAALRDLVERMAAMPVSNHAAYMDLDLQFHQEVCSLSGNTVLVTMWGIAYQVFADIRRTIPATRDFRALSDERHRLLVDALETRDPDRVRATVAKSLEIGEQDIIRALEKSE